MHTNDIPNPWYATLSSICTNDTLNATMYQIQKRRLARVCRCWSVECIKLLYEHIVVPRFSQLKKLVNVLSQTIIADGPGARTFGSYTKRLDLTMPRAAGGGNDEDAAARALLDIFRLCPNLIVLNTTSWILYLPYYLQVMVSLPPGLKALNWLQLPYHFSNRCPGQFLSYLDTRSRLEAADLIDAGPLNTIDRNRIYSSILQLSVILRGVEFPSGSFPNLERVLLRLGKAGPGASRYADPAHLESFLSAHGINLKTLRITWGPAYPVQFDLYLCAVLHQCCPSLKELTFVFTNQEVKFRPSPDKRVGKPLESVHTIGIEDHRTWTPRKKEFGDHLNHLLGYIRLQQVFPNVKTLRLLSERNVITCQTHFPKPFQKFLNECEALGVVVEDHFYRPLNNPAPSIPMIADK